jgi:hypothetical protein
LGGHRSPAGEVPAAADRADGGLSESPLGAETPQSTPRSAVRALTASAQKRARSLAVGGDMAGHCGVRHVRSLRTYSQCWRRTRPRPVETLESLMYRRATLPYPTHRHFPMKSRLIAGRLLKVRVHTSCWQVWIAHPRLRNPSGFGECSRRLCWQSLPTV